MPTSFVRIGRVVKAHGLDGEFVLTPAHGLEPDALVGLDAWVVPPMDAGAVPHAITAWRPASRGVLLTLDGVDSSDQARALAGRWLLASADAVPLFAVEADDVTDYRVVDEVRGLLGVVRDTIVTGANDVLVVDGGPFGEILVPVIDDVVLDVDDAEHTVSVRLLPGLLDEDDV